MQLRIGTRKSALALAQAEILRGRLLGAFPMLDCALVPMLTSGDRSAAPSLADIGGKGLFTRELEEGLLEGHIDIAVHSLKDMEARLPQGLIIGAVLEREDPRDALVAKDNRTLATLEAHARIGTSSPRRAAQLKAVRPDLDIVPFRGNVPTRLAKVRSGEVDATLLALAGLRRLRLEQEASEILDVQRFIPAAGQGTIAVQYKEGDARLHEMLASITHLPTHHATLAERAVLAIIGGSCRTPVAAYARLGNGRLRLDAMLAKPDGTAHVQCSREGDTSEAESLGKDAGAELLARGGKDWLA